MHFGVSDNYSNNENGVIKSLNTLGFIGVFISLIYITIGQVYNTGFLLYESIILFLFALIPILNYLNRIAYSKAVLIFTIVLAMYLGTYLVGYERDFKFAAILAIALIIMFFKQINKAALYFFMALITVFLIGNEVVYYQSIAELSDVVEVNFVYNLVTFFVVIISMIVILLLFTHFVFHAQSELERRVNFETIISEFSENILSGDERAITIVLEKLISEIKVSRISIFENFDDNKEGLCAKITHEICGPNITKTFHHPALQKVVLSKVSFARWVAKLGANKLIFGVSNDFAKEEQQWLQDRGFKSMLAIPIFVHKEWSGFIRFDDFEKEFVWKKEDIQRLRTIAHIIGLHKETLVHQQLITEGNEELRELNATKDKFFSIIAHDLRSPFSALINVSDMLTDKVKALKDDEVLELAELINKASKNTFNLLENLLIWSRTQTGGMRFNPENLILSDIIYENIELAKAMAQEKQLTFNVGALPIELCFADRSMLNTILRNLMTNAIKFSHKDGVIHITCQYINDQGFEFCVMDNGVGMSPERVKELFLINKSYSTTGTKGETGSGLGLFICKEFIEKHDGQIWVESEINQGSRFCFSIPKS